MNRAIVQFCRVRRRFSSQRDEGVGYKIHGMIRATKIRGTPMSEGLMNWSKKLRIMVRFRAQFLLNLLVEVQVRWEMCDLGF